MTSRCKHEDARESTRLDSWLFCPSCRQHIKKKEAAPVRFAEEGH